MVLSPGIVSRVSLTKMSTVSRSISIVRILLFRGRLAIEPNLSVTEFTSSLHFSLIVSTATSKLSPRSAYRSMSSAFDPCSLVRVELLLPNVKARRQVSPQAKGAF